MEPDDQSSIPDEIRSYYALGLERERLLSAEGQLELVRTQELIQRCLPGSPARVLDIGGGPGSYACWLARKGYEVHLVDPIPLHVELARNASARQADDPLASVHLGDARRLAFSAEIAEVVLLLGPLYHLVERSQRLKALREARRVLKKKGVLIAAAISRFASALAGLKERFLLDEEFMRIVLGDLSDGQHRNPTQERNYFTTSFFHHPQEFEREVVEAGFSGVRLLSVEGAAVFLQDLEKQWNDPALRERILEVVRRLEDEPTVMGVTGHLAVIGTK